MNHLIRQGNRLAHLSHTSKVDGHSKCLLAISATSDRSGWCDLPRRSPSYNPLSSICFVLEYSGPFSRNR